MRESGWNLLDPSQVRFELTATGRVDYVLFGPHGPLCILEAKREDADPYDANFLGESGFGDSIPGALIRDLAVFYGFVG